MYFLQLFYEASKWIKSTKNRNVKKKEQRAVLELMY